MTDLWDGEIHNLRGRRKMPRFKVARSLPIQVHFLDQKKSFSAVTFGPRGLGFYGSAKDEELAKLKEAPIQIKMDKYCIDVKASVQYCARVKKEEGLHFYFGLRFLAINPLLGNLLKNFISDRAKRGQLLLC